MPLFCRSADARVVEMPSSPAIDKGRAEFASPLFMPRLVVVAYGVGKKASA